MNIIFKHKIEDSLRWIPDRIYISLMYLYHCKKFLNLNNPKTFSEKIQWLKLYDRNTNYEQFVDKIKVKDYISDLLGGEFVIPTLEIWDTAEKLDITNLPNSFVLKCNHDGHSVIVCEDKAKFDLTTAQKSLRHHLQKNAFWYGREFPYKNIKPLIFAEKYIGIDNEEPKDYKFFCFDGEPIFCQVISDRSKYECVDFFDMYWNHQDFTGLATFRNNPNIIPKPKNLELMISSAKKLSRGFKFIRIDFYETDRMYFGEMTLYPASGFGHFEPYEWNLSLGQLIKLK